MKHKEIYPLMLLSLVRKQGRQHTHTHTHTRTHQENCAVSVENRTESRRSGGLGL